MTALTGIYLNIWITIYSMDIERWFRALSDSTRLQALLLLKAHGSLCVCELVDALGQSQPKVSRHLAQLRDQGLVEAERRGQWVYYRLSPALPDWAMDILDSARRAAVTKGFDAAAISLINRPGAGCD